MSNQPEMIGDVTEAQFHANNLLINKTVNDVRKCQLSMSSAFATMARLAGKLNAHLFHCHLVHVNLGVLSATYKALGDTIAKYDPAQPQALIDNVNAVRAFIEEKAPRVKE